MLVQSHEGLINLLPALPEEWKEGCVKGLKARGGVIVDLTWADGRLESLKVMAESDQTIRLKSGQIIREIDIKKGVSYGLDKFLNSTGLIPTFHL